MDRDAAEHLVAGEGVGPVAALLRAAAAPVYRYELAGEEAAVAAFRMAATGTAAPGRKPVFRKAVVKALTVKAAVVLVIAGSTGIVLAANDGALPMPWSNDPGGPPAPTGTTGTTATSATPPARSSSGAHPSDGRQPPAAPDPAIVGLCEAYVHDVTDLDNPAFGALVEAAGGKDEVPGYCELVETATPSPSAGPGEPTEPGSKPATPPGRPSTGNESPSLPELPGTIELPAEASRPAKPSTTRKHPTSAPTVGDAVTTTPGSPALGAATAVPPSGAEPPSTGG
jgi:hypothetical protein